MSAKDLGQRRMLKHMDKAILYNPDAYKNASWFKKLRARWWDSWIYGVYQYSWAYRLRWFIKHWWCKDNWVKTNLSIGYHDKPQLMEDALFALVENYVAMDQEDAFYNVVVEGEERDTIIQILHFYRVRKPELEKQYDDLLNLCFGDTEWVFHDVPDRECFKRLEIVYHGSLSKEERENKIKELRDLEVQIFNETQDMLKKCVDVRPYLWS
jgi:hypothetical protein